MSETTAGAAVPAPIVVGALHSAEALATATSVLGRRALRIAGAGDLICSVDHEGARALLFELGHPAFADLSTRLAAIGTHLPIVVVLPPTHIPARELFALSRMTSFSLARSPGELPAVIRRTMNRGFASSDTREVGVSLGDRLSEEAATLALGLYVSGTRNASVAAAAQCLGFGSALRNRLRMLGLAKATAILGWASAMGVIWRMEDDESTLAEAARASGFATTRQCSERVLYHTGRTPTALYEHYGFRALVAEFTEVVTARVFSVA